MRSSNPLKDWRPAGDSIMFDPLERIQRRVFPPINFLLKSKWKCLGNFPASDSKCSSAKVMDV